MTAFLTLAQVPETIVKFRQGGKNLQLLVRSLPQLINRIKALQSDLIYYGGITQNNAGQLI
jgi:hypothetical protein